MQLYKKILQKSKLVDQMFEKRIPKEIIFNVPKFHARYSAIHKYRFSQIKLENFKRRNNDVFILDYNVSKIPFVKEYLMGKQKIVLKATEGEVKTKKFLDSLKLPSSLRIVVIGGGLLLNVAAYLAEKRNCDLVQFPTTVLAIADSAGGKVRVNLIKNKRAYKHYYKSCYEPNAMFFDDRFLDYLPKKQIKYGLVEVIKYGLFQSPNLYEFMIGSKPTKRNLVKSALWALSLRKICLDIDVEENENGSRKILRAGHDFSDRIEEDKKFKIPHGKAVAIGIIRQLEMESNKALLWKAKKAFKLFGIN